MSQMTAISSERFAVEYTALDMDSGYNVWKIMWPTAPYGKTKPFLVVHRYMNSNSQIGLQIPTGI